MKTVVLLALLILFGHGIATAAPAIDDPLTSWNEGAAKSSIVSFVEKVTKEGSADFIPPAERIAVFDNDGTLWAEQPIYFQVHIRVRPRQGARAAASGVEGQAAVQGSAARRQEGLRWPAARRRWWKSSLSTHAGMTTDEFQDHRQRLARDGAPSDDSKRPYTEMRLSAHARAARLPARERLQDLHCVRRRCGVHARLGREGVRHPARAGRWQHGASRSSRCVTARPSCEVARPSISSMTRKANLSAFRNSSAGGRSSPSAILTVIIRCCSGPPLGPGAVHGH